MIRELSVIERKLLDCLFEPDFPGRDALRDQAATAKVEELDENIEVLIHVVDGRLNELEIVQKNPEQPVHIPPLSEFKRFCPDNWQID